SYLSRTFKEVTGVPLFDYIYRQRINQARIRFLLDPDASVTDVGYAVGFKHPAHFSRLFKRLMGVSPDRYRRGM
ncbi:helix-turn-helix transcriptional regulator, partial [Microbacteriaceae bacterium K1510]|nr:helix-turn-helix transcriptional regulator [Microbacteriaceae bacterium K1510]